MKPPTLDDMLPDAWPPLGWTLVGGATVPRGARLWLWDMRRLSIVVGVECHPIGVWLHTSVSRQRRGKAPALPSWADLADVKRLVHEDRFCVQALPPRSEYVDLGEVLHLWERLDAPTLPSDVTRRSL